jgi:hypothetical protein
MAWQATPPHGVYQQQFAKCYNNFHTHYKQNFPCFSIKNERQKGGQVPSIYHKNDATLDYSPPIQVRLEIKAKNQVR